MRDTQGTSLVVQLRFQFGFQRVHVILVAPPMYRDCCPTMQAFLFLNIRQPSCAPSDGGNVQAPDDAIEQAGREYDMAVFGWSDRLLWSGLIRGVGRWIVDFFRSERATVLRHLRPKVKFSEVAVCIFYPVLVGSNVPLGSLDQAFASYTLGPYQHQVDLAKQEGPPLAERPFAL